MSVLRMLRHGRREAHSVHQGNQPEPNPVVLRNERIRDPMMVVPEADERGLARAQRYCTPVSLCVFRPVVMKWKLGPPSGCQWTVHTCSRPLMKKWKLDPPSGCQWTVDTSDPTRFLYFWSCLAGTSLITEIMESDGFQKPIFGRF
jgi:hypothetical protein